MQRYIRGRRQPKFSNGSNSRSKLYDEAMDRGDVKMFVAEGNDGLVGVLNLFIVPIFRDGSYHGYIKNLIVTEKMRGKAVGTKLIQEVKDYCKKNKISSIKVTSGFELTDAHRFYEKQGFRTTEKAFRFDF